MRFGRFSPSILGAATLLLVPSAARADDPQSEAAKESSPHFAIDPVADGVVIAMGAGFSGLLGIVLGSGEIRPLLAGDVSVLPSIDRIAVAQTIDPSAGTYSDIGLYAAGGFAVLDSLSTGLGDHWEAAAVDAVMYAESLSLSIAFTDIVKIAVRRPRPIDYSPQNATNTSNTDLALSFFSGHVAAVSAISGTATYLAFVHSPHSARPWITLGAGALLTAFVGYERVRAGQHFPTDVMMGALGGSAIGVLIPHLHKRKAAEGPVWIDLAPTPHSTGGTIGVRGVF